jgi:deoxycytidine triphosphate deaminase
VGASLNQLRLFCGPPTTAVITRDLIKEYGTPFWYVPKDNETRDYEAPVLKSTLTTDPTLCDLTVDLADPRFKFIYKAECKTKESIDLRKGKKSHDPTQYFSRAPINAEGATHSVVLEQDSFYIMKSRERLQIPKDVAVEVVAISERIGDIRIHYAGFAHPGFGSHENRPAPGTPLIFEVRATDMPTKLFDGSLLARIQLFRMSTQVQQLSKSSYDQQELKLSDVFKDWSE